MLGKLFKKKQNGQQAQTPINAQPAPMQGAEGQPPYPTQNFQPPFFNDGFFAPIQSAQPRPEQIWGQVPPAMQPTQNGMPMQAPFAPGAYTPHAYGQSTPGFAPPQQGGVNPPDLTGWGQNEVSYSQGSMQAPPLGMPPMQPQGGQAGPKKQRNLMPLLYLALALTVIFLGVMGVSQLLAPGKAKTAIVTLSNQDTTYSGRALIVRNETVDSQANISTIRYIAAEGAHLFRGNPICVVYTSGFKAKEAKNLAVAREQISQHQQELLNNTKTVDSYLDRLRDVVLMRATETQALIHGAKGNLINQEELLKQSFDELQNYIGEKFQDDPKLTRYLDAETNLIQRINTWTKQLSAVDDGIVSFYTDGFESVLNTSSAMRYSPGEVESMLMGTIPKTIQVPGADKQNNQDISDIYRLVRPNVWSALMLADDTEWNPVAGDEYTMLVESFENTQVKARVESVTKSENKLLVRLVVQSDVTPMLYLRSARLQLSKNVISYAVPKSAIYTQNGIKGVVALFDVGEFLIPVDVVSEDATQANIIPLSAGYLYEGMSVRLFK